MKTKFKGILTLLLAFVVQITFAQEQTVSGTVVDENNLPLPGATVIVKGTTNGTSTDFDGKYSIKTNNGETLEFSYVGYATQAIAVTSNTVNVSMTPDNSLDEIVIEAAYDIKRAKPLVNSAIATLDSGTIENRPNTSAIQTLQGQVAGVNITTSTGQPGSNSEVLIRGVGSVDGSTAPLYVVDGVPVRQSTFRTLNPNDIKSVSVLKDAGATAIYGNRGTNGAIIVTTRGGSFNSDLKFTYSGTTNISRIQNSDYNLMSSRQQLELERTFGAGAGVGLTDAEIATRAQINTNWADEFFRDALTHTHTISATSGGENTNTFTSLSYTDQDGILRGSSLKRFNVRNNLNGKSKNDKFKYGTNLSLSYIKNDIVTSVGTGGVNQNFIIGAYRGLPYLNPSDYTPGEGGSIVPAFANAPFLLLDKLSEFTNNEDEIKILASVNGSLKLTNTLTANSRFSADYSGLTSLRAQSPLAFNSLFFAETGNDTPGFQSHGSIRQLTFSAVNSINFEKTFNEKHTVNAGAYVEYIKNHYRQFGFVNNGLDIKTWSPGDGSGFVDDNSANDFFSNTVSAQVLNSGLFSYFAIADYDYDNKYGFGATFRRDASSRFVEENQWGTFYSLSARWNIDQESFMENSKFNLLKLRASHGTTGNQNIVNASYYSGLTLTDDLYSTGSGYGGQNSIQFSQFGNPALKWETTTQTNIGLDFGVWNNKLSGTMDVFKREADEAFTNAPVQAAAGQTSVDRNFGAITNKGIELALRYKVLQNKDGLNVSLNANGTYIETTRTNPSGLTGIEDGGKFGQYFVVRYAGVNPANGNLMYYDIDGNLTDNPNVDTDRVFTNKNRLPDYQGGFGIDVDYKGFYFTTQFNYAIGIDRFDYDYSDLLDTGSIGSFRTSADLLNAWTPTNTVTNIPSLTATNLNNLDASQSDRFLQNADYLRMRFVSLGYNFKSDYLKRLKLDNLKIFVSGENLLTFSKWRGYDAEGAATTQGDYPTPKTFSAGIEIGF